MQVVAGLVLLMTIQQPVDLCVMILVACIVNLIQLMPFVQDSLLVPFLVTIARLVDFVIPPVFVILVIALVTVASITIFFLISIVSIVLVFLVAKIYIFDSRHCFLYSID